MGNMTCTVAIIKEDDGYVAKDIQTSVASQGNSIEKALDNLKEALELYYEDLDCAPQSSVFTSHAKFGNGEPVYIIPMHEGDLK